MFRSALRTACICLLGCASAVSAQNLASTLQSKLTGKLLYLRVPEPGTKLRFDANGAPTHKPGQGLRSLDGILQVRKLTMNNHDLSVHGERFAIIWDQKNKRPEYTDINEPVTVEIGLTNGSNTTEAQFAPVFFKAFYSGNDLEQHACTTEENKLFAEKVNNVRINPPNKGGITLGLWQLEPSPQLCLPSGERVLGPGKGMQPPKVLKQIVPQYPLQARVNRVQGTAVYLVVIDKTGTPTDAIMVRSADPSLNYSGLEALRGWRFKPAEINGQPTACAVNIDINYKLY